MSHYYIPYRGKVWRGEKFGEFGELSAIRQTKLVLTINNLLADLLIRQTFFRQMLETSQFAKLSRYTIHNCLLNRTNISRLTEMMAQHHNANESFHSVDCDRR